MDHNEVLELKDYPQRCVTSALEDLKIIQRECPIGYLRLLEEDLDKIAAIITDIKNHIQYHRY